MFVGGSHGFYDFPLILGISSSQLPKSIIFQRGRLNHQPDSHTLSIYPLVKVYKKNQKTIEIPHFSWVNQLFLWQCWVFVAGFGDGSMARMARPCTCRQGRDGVHQFGLQRPGFQQCHLGRQLWQLWYRWPINSLMIYL